MSTICATCGHSASYHNDAGSEPEDPGLAIRAEEHGTVPRGQMCCYAKPGPDSPGVRNWGNTICGCSHEPPGSARYY